MEEFQKMDESLIPERHRSLPVDPAVVSQLTGALSQDHHKIQVTIELSNGFTRPDLELILFAASHQKIARTTVIENLGPRMVFTMHIRQPEGSFPLTLRCQLSYLDDQVFSEKEISIESE